jgi:CRISPR-associated protein Cas1
MLRAVVMDMATLYLTEQGTTLRKEQNRLVVERDDVTLSEIHEFKVERVVVFGNVQLTTQVISFLFDRGIDTTFLSLKGKLKGRLAPIASKNIALRVSQYRRAADSQFALRIAKAIVSAKIANCAEVLRRHQRNHAESNVSGEVSQIVALSQKAAHRQNAGELRGIEGQAASVYFQGFARCLRRRMNFTRRTRRPPRDPINSLLGLGYTLLYNETIGALVAVGFDPYLGFYHSLDYGRCSLALDLMEEMRPIIIDRLALNLANLEIVKPEDFTTAEDQGVYLASEGRKRLLREYERMMTSEFTNRRTNERTSFRRALIEQALALQRAVTGGEPYQTFQGWR